MTGYGFYRVMRMMIISVLMVVMALGGFVFYAGYEIFTELKYRHTYGANWRAQFESIHGPLSQVHLRIGLCVFGFVAVSILLMRLYRLLQGNSSGRRRRRHRSLHSHGDRTARYRRNAWLGIGPGLAGIVLGAMLVLFRIRLFADPGNEFILGILVFIGGYGGVIAGCYYWLKAKELNDAIAIIGLLPLAVLFIPYVRLIFWHVPMLLLAGMILMPTLLIGIVMVLPDRSGPLRRR